MPRLVLLTDTATRIDAAQLRDALQRLGPGFRFKRPELSLDTTERLIPRNGGHLHVTRVSRPFDDPDFDMALVDAGPEETDQVVHHRRHFVIEAQAGSQADTYALLWASAREVAALIGATILFDPEELKIQSATTARPAAPAPMPEPGHGSDPSAGHTGDAAIATTEAPPEHLLERVFLATQSGYTFLGTPIPASEHKRRAWRLSLLSVLLFPIIGIGSALTNLVFGAHHGRAKKLFVFALVVGGTMWGSIASVLVQASTRLAGL